MNSTLSAVANPNDQSLPGYAIAILAVGIIIIAVIVMIFVIRSLRRRSQRRAEMDVRNIGMADVIAERRRLFSGQESL